MAPHWFVYSGMKKRVAPDVGEHPVDFTLNVRGNVAPPSTSGTEKLLLAGSKEASAGVRSFTCQSDGQLGTFSTKFSAGPVPLFWTLMLTAEPSPQ